MKFTRLVTVDDADVLLDVVRLNREFLAPWEPSRREEYFTLDRQRAVIRTALEAWERGANLPCVILGDSGQVVGKVSLNGIVRGAFQSCSVSYWVSRVENGHGLATAAVREIVDVAFGELGLHRVQAETLLHNVKSQRVLERNDFVRFATAPAYLKIAGRWQDHAIYQKLAPTTLGA